MGITENAAYIKGLFDGFDLDKNSKENKIISALIDLVSDMADKLDALEAENKELLEYVDELDYDLGALEEDYYDTCDGDCDECEFADECEDYSDLNDDDDFDFDEDDGYCELECPHCGEIIGFGASLDMKDLVCPSCGEALDSVESDDDE